MRPVHLCDLDTVVRAMLAVAPVYRCSLAREIVDRAWLADRYRKRLRRRHGLFGDGTLAGAAQICPKVPVQARCDRAYLDCLGQLTRMLATKERFDLTRAALYRSQTVPYEGQGHGNDKDTSPPRRSGLATDL